MKRVWCALLLAAMQPALLAPPHAADPATPPPRPNILIILVDDMGYSDLGCFGGEIHTPNLDRLAAGGVKFAEMYNTAKCFPTRACLQTGVYFQRTDKDFARTATLGEVLRPAGYITLWSGKHHAKFSPTTRGYDRFYGMLGGCENHFNPGSRAVAGQPTPVHKNNGNRWALDGTEADDFVPHDPDFYDTDAFTDRALQWLDEYEEAGRPFLLHVAYTAPHWPLQARPEDIARYTGAYDGGYDAIRKARYERQIELGLVDPRTSPLPPMEYEKRAAKEWASLSPQERAQQAMKMEVYAAMLDRVDQNIGRLVDRLDAQGKLADTLILFLSDNGACAETPADWDNTDPTAPMGSVATFINYGPCWATVGNTPLRRWKTNSFEGGVCTPLVAHWPAGIEPRSGYIREPAHVIDIMPTVLDVAEASYPGASKQPGILPLDGVSLMPAFQGQPLARPKPLFFQFNKGAAVRDGRRKLVRNGPTWELYDLATDRTETRDLASEQPDVVSRMYAAWLAWWEECTGSEWTGMLSRDGAGNDD